MKSFHKPSRRAKNASDLPPSPPLHPFPEGPLDLRNPEHARVWFHALREAAADLAAAAREGGRRLKHRVLSRAELRRQARAAERSVNGLVEEGEAALR